MIRSWLDEYFPLMPDAERKKMAEAMDVSLVEQTKESAMKTFYELNNVVRMSFIEMQYMKKVRRRHHCVFCTDRFLSPYATATCCDASGNDECLACYG